ncbi:MAG TPA: glycosyltransferase family 39 protein, partial [Chloroflexota bacterium]
MKDSVRLERSSWALCALLLLAWLLHWRTFGLEELGQDGYLSVDLGLGSLGEMLRYVARDVHPPLFFALLHGMFALGGRAYPVAKLLPIAAAQLSLVLIYRLVRQLAGSAAAWWATVLLLLSVPFLLLAPTVRPFTLGLCCSLLSLLLVVRWRAPPERHVRQRQVVLALVTAAALLSWYLQLFVLVLEALLCWRGRQRSGDHPAATSAGIGSRGLVALAGGVLLAAPLYAFVLPGLLAKMRQGITVTEGTPALPSATTVLAG